MVTAEQAQAIASEDRRLQVIACADSGTTETIARRIALLVDDGIPPPSIVAFTITERAAAEMGVGVRFSLRAPGNNRDGLNGLSSAQSTPTVSIG